MNKRAVVDQSRCVGCGSCVELCPQDAIRLEEEKEKPFSVRLSAWLFEQGRRSWPALAIAGLEQEEVETLAKMEGHGGALSQAIADFLAEQESGE